MHRGVGGAAGEIGYLPVPGVPLPQDVTHPATGAFQSLVGAQAVLPLAARIRLRRAAGGRGRARRAVAAAGRRGRARRGRSSPSWPAGWRPGSRRSAVVLDPGLVVLGGEVGLAGGTALAGRVAAEVGRICPARPAVVPTGVTGGPVLRGAILAAVDQARGELLASVADA